MIAILLAMFALASMVPEESRPPTFDYNRRLIAVAMAHQCEYVLGAVALLIIAI
jgi:hypothetical protein